MERASKNVGYDDRMVSGQGYDLPGYASAAYQAYCNQVCSFLKKATKKEKASLSEELYDHMESHAEALVELGWDPEEARIYAIHAMGDAETVGRQYDEKLSSFWLWCGYVVRVLCVVFAIWLVWRGMEWMHVMKFNFEARLDPYTYGLQGGNKENVLRCDEMDIRIPSPSGKHVIRVYQTEISSQPAKEIYKATIYVVNYPKNPLDTRSRLVNYMTVEGYHGSSFHTTGCTYHDFDVEVEKGQESVTLSIAREITGTDIQVEIPLNWEGIP